MRYAQRVRILPISLDREMFPSSGHLEQCGSRT